MKNIFEKIFKFLGSVCYFISDRFDPVVTAIGLEFFLIIITLIVFYLK